MSDVLDTVAPKIPYGRADFRGMRLDGSLYVDKTRFVRLLENHRYVLFIRPRRFGKTCWLSTLECYYDRRAKDDFEAVFGGTEMGEEPTANRSRYVVLRLNFSAFGAQLDKLEEEFDLYCFRHLRATLERHPDMFSEDARRNILAPPSVAGRLDALFLHVAEHGIPLYMLIDEYDNFASNVLARHGEAAYYSFTRDEGFYRSFFTTLKAGTDAGALERLFITGVSPVAMDDVTSGFNIGRNLSLDPQFNEMLGFTEDEVRQVLRTYHVAGALEERPEDALRTMREWYNGYRFAEDAERDVYNTDMVLYYLAESLGRARPPEELIDYNVRVDYGKLRHLLTVGGRLNGNFDLLRTAMAEGGAECRVRRGFPLRELEDRDNFLSLLHYFGLLSIRATAADDAPQLIVPNQTAHHLLHAFLRDAYRDVGAFRVDLHDLERLMRRMALFGEWRPTLDLLATAIHSQTSVRDYLAGEKMIQGFLAAYLGVTDHFLFSTEQEFNKGFADICLAPFAARYRTARHGYLLELKYVRRDEGEAKLEVALTEAMQQLERYLADERLVRQRPEVSYTGLAVVFHGWELARCGAVEVAA